MKHNTQSMHILLESVKMNKTGFERYKEITRHLKMLRKKLPFFTVILQKNSSIIWDFK